MTHLLSTLACGKVLVVLEGGYNVTSIALSVAAIVRVLLGESPPMLPDPHAIALRVFGEIPDDLPDLTAPPRSR